MNARERKLAWIQALRGIAAFMVVMVHSRSVLPGTFAGKAVADYVLLPMAMGVDLFFIISGFLMVLTTLDFDGTHAYAWRFAAKRIARIWPLFAVVTVVAVAVDHHGIRGFLDASVLLPYLEGLLFVPHNPAASHIYFQMSVGVAWTLCFECYFYVVFALCMLFGRWRYRVMAAWFVLTLIAIPVLRGGYNLGVATQPLVAWSRYANLAVNPIVWEFVFGMLAGWLYGSRLAIKNNATVYAIAIALIAMLLMGWNRIGMVNFFGPQGWGAPLAILFFGVVMLAKNGAIKVPAWSVWVGEISYSLYLVHVYVFEIVQRIVVRIPMSHDMLAVVLFVTRPILAVLCAWATFRCIEAPASAWTRRWLLRLRWPCRRARTGAVDAVR
ncbi:acyltransferase family protein [Dyella psychrodurans]|uniref:Acyltransferase n=1 Tax=Dyella psychrodurans TaxID=1927960 RepID=A0A370WW51_9GAMM|nr:acyltransferase [Dyella psychrodurans]RDS80378.1 acyltransferase [Dyella psychrodurans]